MGGVNPTGPRRALVTGGARRVGRAVVEMLCRDGWHVTLTYHRSRDEAERLCGSLPGATAVACDLTDADDAEALARRIAALPGLDLLVHNASDFRPDPSTHDPAFSRAMFALHYDAPLRLSRAAEPLLRACGGSVVTMLDLLAERPWPAYRTYSASKSALWNLTLSLAREMAPEARVNGIAPGVVEWPADYPEPERAAYLRRVPLGRAGTALDVARAVRFLAVDAPYMTGAVLRLDGGRSTI